MTNDKPPEPNGGQSEPDQNRPTRREDTPNIPGGGVGYLAEIPINPVLLDVLQRVEPEQALDYLNKADERLVNAKNLEFSLRDKQQENQHTLAVKREEIIYMAQKATTNNIRLALGAFFAIFISTMVYAGMTGDKNLPDKVFTAAIGLVAGGSGAALIKRSEPAKTRKDEAG